MKLQCSPEELKAGSVPLNEIEAMLAKAQIAINKLDEAQRKPQCVFLFGLSYETLLPHVQVSRQFGRLGYIQLYYARKTGHFNEAEQTVRRLLRLSRDLRPRGVMVCQLVSITHDGMVFSSIANFTLTQPGLGVKECDRLLAVLEEHESKAVSLTGEGIRAEYLNMRNTLDNLRSGKMTTKQFGHLLSVIAEDTELSNEEKAAEYVLNQVNWEYEISTCNSLFSLLLDPKLAPSDRDLLEQQVQEKLQQYKTQNGRLIRLLFPATAAFFEAAARAETRLAGIQCLVAVRRYQLQHGTLPTDLAAATSEAGLKEVPKDPYSGQPLLYKVIDGKPVVYSIGPDRKDDGGTDEWDQEKQSGDFTFRIRE